MAERDTGLFDHLGRRVIVKELPREVAAPTLAGIRQIFDTSVASGLTPQRLASLLLDASAGDHDAYLTLAEEMEERDPHYAAELSKRKLAVSRLPITVEAASDEQKDIDLADEVRALIRRPGTRMLLKDMLDGLGKGFSVVEIDWQRGSKWLPQRYQWRDPHFFQFDRVARQEIRLRDEADSYNGLELQPFKFICHVPKIKSGIPIRGGLARLVAWAYMCKGYTVKDWLAFAEVFGMPFRVGKYGNSASEEDKAVLRRAVANIGSDAAATIPESMLIEFIESGGKQGSAEFFKILAQYMDDQVSKAVLGQTASSSGTPGKLGNEELQGEVRDDIRDDDAEQLAETLNRDLVKPFIDLNFGPQENYPCISIAQPDAEDVQTIITACEKLVPLGLRVEQSVIRDKIGLPDPDKNAKPEDLLQILTVEPVEPKPEAQQPEMNMQKALNAQNQEQDDIETILEDEMADWQKVMTPIIDPLAELLAGARTFDELKEKLATLPDDQDLQPLVDRLAAALLKARALGDTDEG